MRAHQVYSKADALSLATKEKFDLYLLDYHVPDGNGIELCLLIKNFDTETPILFVTGTSSMTEKQALKIGAKGSIKNTSNNFIDQLQKKVSELLEDLKGWDLVNSYCREKLRLAF
jgi:DNA-binding response OmpR family regulator